MSILQGKNQVKGKRLIKWCLNEALFLLTMLAVIETFQIFDVFDVR